MIIRRRAEMLLPNSPECLLPQPGCLRKGKPSGILPWKILWRLGRRCPVRGERFGGDPLTGGRNVPGAVRFFAGKRRKIVFLYPYR